jgi:hypothetical protein
MIQYLSSGKGKLNGDKDKAMQAVYEVLVGEGAEVEYDAEQFLHLGTGVTTRVEMVQDYFSQALNVFGNVANRVSIDK